MKKQMEPLRILVTGAAGQIAYSLLYALARGDVFGPDQPISLILLDIEAMIGVLHGVVMELVDCALPMLKDIIPTADIPTAFRDIDIALLVGAMPRREGMERRDLLKANIRIFKQQGQALDQYAKKSVKVVVVGNPVNTNAFICKKYAPSLSAQNFTCLSRLDQNRAQAQIAQKLKAAARDIHNITVWGNHSSTLYPDVRFAYMETNGERIPVLKAINDENYIRTDFVSSVQTRGTAVIAARKLSSAMSATQAVCDHLRSWWFGTEEDQWVSMGVLSDGSYDIEPGLFFSFPVRINSDRTYSIVKDLEIDDYTRKKLDESMKELLTERSAALLVFQD